MADSEETPKPETLNLFRKKHSPAVLVLGVLGVVIAILVLVYMIWSALQPPDLQFHYEEPAKEKRR